MKESKLTKALNATLRFMFPPPNVANILADFEATKGRLLAARDAHLAAGAEAERKAAALVAKAVRAQSEARRAERAASRIASIIE